MYNAETQYLEIAKEILESGIQKKDRTGTGTISLWGRSIRHDYSEGFPILTTKKIFTKAIIHELLWIISGNTNVKYLQDNGVRIWNEWADKDGNLGPVYGKQWRKWSHTEAKYRTYSGVFSHIVDNSGWEVEKKEIDQLTKVIEGIKTSPYSRRHLLTFWNPADVSKMALPPCHGIATQFNVHLDKDKPASERLNDGKKGDISIATVQRSADFFLGVPFNIASYSFLLYMVGEITNLRPKEMYYTFHDCHIYNNHIEQVKLQLSRNPYKLPKIKVNHKDSIDDFVYDDFIIEDYKSHEAIRAKVSV